MQSIVQSTAYFKYVELKTDQQDKVPHSVLQSSASEQAWPLWHPQHCCIGHKFCMTCPIQHMPIRAVKIFVMQILLLTYWFITLTAYLPLNKFLAMIHTTICLLSHDEFRS